MAKRGPASRKQQERAEPQGVNDVGASMRPPGPPPKGRESGRALPNLVLAAALVALSLLIIATALSVYAIFTGTTSVTPNDFASDTLDPPTGLTAQSGVSVILGWTATSDTYASGHRVLRSASPGGPYSQIAQLTPRTETTFTDNPAAGTYYYVVKAYYQSWESANSGEGSATKQSTTRTGFHNPNNQAAVTSGSGDNNGFETNPTYAFTDSTFYAEDVNSGTGTSTSCSDAGKDRHQFFDYDFGVPTGSTVNGIEVRLDAWADSTVGGPFMCVELSWDGGATWTATKNTATLGTAEATFTLGTTSDTWGRTWTASEFSNTNFRVRVTSVASDNTRDFRLEWLPVQVSYVAP